MAQKILSFYPGPSQLKPAIGGYMAEAVESGLLSMNHRSPAFVDLAKETEALLAARFSLPKGYRVMFAGSATECWAIVAHSFASLNSLHVFNGAFGEKWFQSRQRLYQNTLAFPFHCQRSLGMNGLKKMPGPDMVCLTQNETSNGTRIGNKTLEAIRKVFPGALIAVDATSSMGGVETHWHKAGIWFASVQKCFGLPAGLAVLICSPDALDLAAKLGHTAHYNNLQALHLMAQRHQTVHTPNVLGIYLLMRSLRNSPTLAVTAGLLKKRASEMYAFLVKHGYRPLVGNSRVRSHTVLAVEGRPAFVSALKAAAFENGILLGNGYGAWKENTFRIANFPALSAADFETLKSFLAAHSPKTTA